MNNSRAAVFLATGYEECEALLVVGLLRRAGIDVDIVAVTEESEVISSHGVRVLADKLLSDISADDYTLLFLPGGMPGSDNLRASSRLCDMLVQHYNAGKVLAAVCAAPYVFAELGFLNGKAATSHPAFREVLIKNGAEYSEAPVVVSGNLITSRGLGTSIELAAKLVAVLKSEELANDLLVKIVYSVG